MKSKPCTFHYRVLIPMTAEMREALVSEKMRTGVSMSGQIRSAIDVRLESHMKKRRSRMQKR